MTEAVSVGDVCLDGLYGVCVCGGGGNMCVGVYLGGVCVCVVIFFFCVLSSPGE